jgi:2-isopropylmalate synthase
VQAASEGNGEISSQRIHEIFQQEYLATSGPLSLIDYDIQAKGKDGNKRMHVQLQSHQENLMIESHSDGALEAFCQALAQHLNINIDVMQYSQSALGTHTQAQALASLEMNIDGQLYKACAIEQDSLKASFIAIVTACNKCLATQALVA